MRFLPCNSLCGTVDSTDQRHVSKEGHGCEPWQESAGPKLAYGKESPRLPKSDQPIDPILGGLLAAKSAKGQAARIRKALIEDAKQELAKLETKVQREEAVRQLIGPKGGLPTLKGRFAAPGNFAEARRERFHEGERLQAADQAHDRDFERSTDSGEKQSGRRCLKPAQGSKTQSKSKWCNILCSRLLSHFQKFQLPLKPVHRAPV